MFFRILKKIHHDRLVYYMIVEYSNYGYDLLRLNDSGNLAIGKDGSVLLDLGLELRDLSDLGKDFLLYDYYMCRLYEKEFEGIFDE